MQHYEDPSFINVGPNREVSIKDLSTMIAKAVGYEGEILWDISKPNGTARRVLDTSKMEALGWQAKTSLEDGINKTVDWFLANRGTYVRL
jgi:GDP-L-fucose synthase